MFQQLNSKKAAGPDNISPCLRKQCAGHLSGVFTDIFSVSLSQCKIPLCFKKSTIIPVPKQFTASCLNAYRIVALNSVLTTTLKRLVLQFLKSIIDPLFDRFQFAYRKNRSVEDAVSLWLFYVLQHIYSPNTYAWILFVDYSSSFNTITPSKLFEKIQNVSVPQSMYVYGSSIFYWAGCENRWQLTLSTGTPQGCVLSLMLYSLFTYNFVSCHESPKYWNLLMIIHCWGLLPTLMNLVNKLISWCSETNVELYVNKNKKEIVDVRRKKSSRLLIDGKTVEIVQHFMLFGSTISNNLKWELNIDTIVKKVHFLRRLRAFGLTTQTMLTFCRSPIESVLTFSITVWFGYTTVKEKLRLNRVVKTASRIMGRDLPSLESLYQQRLFGRVILISHDSSHPPHDLFNLLPFSRLFRSIKTRTNRFSTSFPPSRTSIVKTEVIFLPSVVHTQSTFNVL